MMECKERCQQNVEMPSTRRGDGAANVFEARTPRDNGSAKRSEIRVKKEYSKLRSDLLWSYEMPSFLRT